MSQLPLTLKCLGTSGPAHLNGCGLTRALQIDDEAIMRFLRQLPKQQFLEIQDKHGAQLPLIFDNATEQLNVIAYVTLSRLVSVTHITLSSATVSSRS